jgi:hypothetical protein
MKKSKYYLFLLLIFIVRLSNAQNYSVDNSIKSKDLKDLTARTLLVVVDNEGSEQGKAITSAFNQYWKVTSFKYIKSAEIDTYINNPEYSIFTFYDQFTVGGGVSTVVKSNTGAQNMHGGSGDLAVFTRPDFIMDNNSASNEYYGCGIFFCGSGIKRTNYSRKYLIEYNGGLLNINFIDNINIVTHSPGSGNGDIIFNTKYRLGELEDLSTQFTSFYIERLARHLDYLYVNGRNPESKEMEVKIPFKYNGKEKDANAKITSYNDGLFRVRKTRILVGNNITDNLGKELLAKGLGVPIDSIALVSWDKIQDAVEKHDPTVAVIFLRDNTASVVCPYSMYSIWSTDGTRLVDFHISGAKFFSYVFYFDKKSSQGIDRNEIQVN